MSQKRARKSRQEAREFEDMVELRFHRSVPMTPPANFWTRVAWFLSPKRRRKALLDWTLKREEARKLFMARVLKQASHTIADRRIKA